MNIKLAKIGIRSYFDYQCQEDSEEAKNWDFRRGEFHGKYTCDGWLDENGKCEKCGHQATAYTEDVFKREIIGSHISTVIVGDRATKINVSIINNKIDVDEDLVSAVMQKAVEKLYGKHRSYWINNGYPSGDDFLYCQIIESCVTGGYNTVTPIIRIEID